METGSRHETDRTIRALADPSRHAVLKRVRLLEEAGLVIPSQRLIHTFSATWSTEVRRDVESRYAWRLDPWGSGMTRVSIEHSGIPIDPQTEAEVEQGRPCC